jgi:4-hydroxy-3-polyprenylbenzoate decarboxylase
MLVITITGASGAIYAQRLLQRLPQVTPLPVHVAVVITPMAREIWHAELGTAFDTTYPVYSVTDFNAPFASGSAGYTCNIVCPCSMGTLGRIASGTSDDLVARCADVMLKERRRLILVTRETPLSLVHLRNMVAVTEAGGIVLPASPHFYYTPQTPAEIADTVVNRALQLAGFNTGARPWGGTP